MNAKILKLKYPIIVVNTNRTERKTYMIQAHLQEAIDRANKFGCHGSILLHDEDGSEICDDEILEYHLQRKAIFMICNHCSDWRPQSDPTISVKKVKNAVAQIQASPIEIKTKNSGDAENLNITTNKKTVSTEKTPSAYSTVTSTDHFESTKIFRSGQDCIYPEFIDFEIPWDKVPLDIMAPLANGEPLLRKTNALANLLIDELRLLKPNLSIPVMRIVAERVVSLYPQSFQPPGMERNTSDLSSSFLAVLKNRYFNIMRGFIKTKSDPRKHYKSIFISHSNDEEFSSNHDKIDVSPNHNVEIDVKIEYDSLSSFE